jgi:Protein of unknown function (DUF3891)
VIVRDLGDAWQVVMQPDHADLSAAFARAWATPLSPSLVIATERHDDGWAVWEQSPRVDGDGKPVGFLDVDVRAHLAFYRAGIAAITEEDADAGLLVSMHGAGIYKQRYGLDTALGLSRAAEVQGDVDAFVAEQEAKFGGEPGDRWRDYELLQLFDRLSLYFCMRDGEEVELQGYRIEPVAPWHVRLSPYPFGAGAGGFSLLRRVIPKNGRADVLGTAPERVEITVEAS